VQARCKETIETQKKEIEEEGKRSLVRGTPGGVTMSMDFSTIQLGNQEP
jgi:hypothetical protein